MVKNKYIVALLRTMLLFASTHIAILFILSIREQTVDYLNLFAILELDRFIPGIATGMSNFLLSVLVGGVIYCAMVYVSNKNQSQ